VRSIISCNVFIYITIYSIFSKPITTTTVPTTNSQIGEPAKSEVTYPIYCKSFEFAINAGIL
jgi:hypothetical protein